jgi:hypothetical protein
MTEAFGNYIAQISQAPTFLERVRIAQEAFGKSWQTAMLLAAQGAGEFQKQADSAFTITQKAVRIASELDNQFRAVRNAVEVGFNTGFLEGFGGELGTTKEQLQGLHDTMVSFGATVGSVFRLAANAVIQLGNEIAENQKQTQGYINAINAYRQGQIGLLELGKGLMDPRPFMPAPKDLLPDFDVGAFVSGLNQMNTSLGVGRDLAKEAADSARALKQALAEGAAVFESTRTPLEKYNLELERLSGLLRRGAIDADTFGRAQAMAAATAVQPWLQVVGTFGQAFGTLFEENKAFAIAQAIINTLQGITAAIAQYPPPLSYTMAAAQAALGFAQVAKIQSTTPGSSGGGAGKGKGSKGQGFQLGGLIPGSGLGDKFHALLEPQEIVVNRNAARRFRPLLEEINTGTPRLAAGGSVGGGSGRGGLGVTVVQNFEREIITDDISASRFARRLTDEIDGQIRRRYGRKAF